MAVEIAVCDDERGQPDRQLRSLRLHGVGPVLELTSGTGRLSVPLMKAGAHLTCVDVSAGMLRVLRRKVVAAGLRANIVRAGMCDLPFSQAFLLAFVPFQAFLEIVGESRQRRALSAVYASLRPGGRFICTLHSPAVRRSGRGTLCQNPSDYAACRARRVPPAFRGIVLLVSH